MKISKKDQKTLLYVLGVLMVVAVYFLFYSSKQEELQALQDEVDVLHAEVMQLEEYELNSVTYKKNIEKYYAQIADMADDFPAAVKEESIVMYARNLEKDFTTSVSRVDMSPSALVSSFGVGERQKHLYNAGVTLAFTGSYDSVKNVIQDVYDDHEKKALTSLNLSYDNSTGGLSVQAKMNFYSLAGKDQIYEEPDTGNIQHGTGNIFGQ